LCIDACDDVMGRIGLPPRLIAYDTDANVARRKAGRKARFRFVRPRTVFYAAIIVLVSAIMVTGLSTRQTIALDVLRDRNPNYVVLSDGAIRNGYTLKLMNRTGSTRDLYLAIAGVRPRRVVLIGLGDVTLPVRLSVDADKVRSVRLLLTVAPRDLHPGVQKIVFRIGDARHSESHDVASVFVSGDQP
jgi:polyferredoxin